MTSVSPHNIISVGNKLIADYPALLCNVIAGDPDVLLGQARLDFVFDIDISGVILQLPAYAFNADYSVIKLGFSAQASVENLLFAQDNYQIPLKLLCYGNVDPLNNPSAMTINGAPYIGSFSKKIESHAYQGKIQNVGFATLPAYAAANLSDFQTTAIFKPNTSGAFNAKGILIAQIELHGAN